MKQIFCANVLKEALNKFMCRRGTISNDICQHRNAPPLENINVGSGKYYMQRTLADSSL